MTAKEVNSTLDSYDQKLDKAVPWEQLMERVETLNQNRYNYSEESADLIGKFKENMVKSMDSYFISTKNVYEWCGVATPLLKEYRQLLNESDQEKFEANKKTLLNVLKEGEVKPIGGLFESYTSYFVSGEILTRLLNRYNERKAKEKGFIFSDEKSKFLRNSRNKIYFGFLNIVEEMKKVNRLSVQTQTAMEFIHLDGIKSLQDVVTEEVDILTNACDEYRKKHQ